MTDWAANNDLVILNDGGKSTFFRGAAQSILDLPWSSSGNAYRIRKWRVLEEETLSDHHYTFFWAEEPNKAMWKWAERKWKIGWIVPKLH